VKKQLNKPIEHVMFEKWFKKTYGGELSWTKLERLSTERRALAQQLRQIEVEIANIERSITYHDFASQGWRAAKELAKKQLKASR
jgi:hypothetical protein